LVLELNRRRQVVQGRQAKVKPLACLGRERGKRKPAHAVTRKDDSMTTDSAFTKEQRAAYFDSGLCPFCGAPEICRLPWQDVDAFAESRDVICHDCEGEWPEVNNAVVGDRFLERPKLNTYELQVTVTVTHSMSVRVRARNEAEAVGEAQLADFDEIVRTTIGRWHLLMSTASSGLRSRILRGERMTSGPSPALSGCSNFLLTPYYGTEWIIPDRRSLSCKPCGAANWLGGRM
jgi:hypothetical protein